MKNVLNYLASLKLITDVEKKEVIKAKYYNSEIPLEFGTALKRELYNHFLRSSLNSPILDEISKNSRISNDEVFASAIVTDKIIKTIKIINSNE